MKDFRKLKVWAKAHALTLEIYRITSAFPPDEQDGLMVNLRRSAISIPGKIARGCGFVTSRKWAARCFEMAAGSVRETQYHLLLARDLGYVSNDDYPHLDNELHEIEGRLGLLIVKIHRGSKD